MIGQATKNMAWALGAVVLLASPCAAQNDFPKRQIYVGYAVSKGEQVLGRTEITLKGWQATLHLKLHSSFGLLVDVGGQYEGPQQLPAAQVHQFLLGLGLIPGWEPGGHLLENFFGHFLIGGMTLHTPSSGSQTVLGIGGGLGLQFPVNDRLAIRLQAAGIASPALLSPGQEEGGGFGRFGAGVVFRLDRPRKSAR